jgi:hypothetical protein
VHLLRDVPDPHGDRLVLAVVVAGSSRSVVRARQKMAAVPVEALTAGPSLQRRPVDGQWLIGPAAPDVPAVTPGGLPGLEPVVPTVGAVPDPDGLPGLEPIVPAVRRGPEPPELPGLEPVVPARVTVSEPEPSVPDEPAPPPAMVPVVVTFARDAPRWAGDVAEDGDGASDDGGDDGEPAIPEPRGEQARADV